MRRATKSKHTRLTVHRQAPTTPAGLNRFNAEEDVMRLILLGSLLVFASAASAQGSLALTGSLPSTHVRTYLYEVDLGASAQAFTVTVNLNTSAASGLTVRLIDVRGLAGDATPVSTFVDSQVVAGAGTANCAQSGSASGVRCFVVEVSTTSAGTSVYSGTVNATAGALTFVVEDLLVIAATGLKLQVGKLATYTRSMGVNLIAVANVALDFGGASQTVPVRFEATGTGLSKIDVYDNTSGSATLLSTFTAVGGSINDTTVLVLTHTGEARLRVNVSSTTGGSVTWRLTVPCTVTVGLPSAGDIKGEDSDECSTSEGSNASLMLIAVLCALAVTARVSRKSCGA